jgi:hypothetical protein
MINFELGFLGITYLDLFGFVGISWDSHIKLKNYFNIFYLSYLCDPNMSQVVPSRPKKPKNYLGLGISWDLGQNFTSVK